ncbi:hypothetical protein LCGC14_0445830 [marine sediment metagenome]|uniref:Uncharacterized protein n=1 Tax=marine sediment metagenome TaxID=412755 RepID=A0A0F9V5X3_9ZZZZ
MKCCLGCWKTTAPFGEWCTTWDIPSALDDEETRLMRSAIAMWQPGFDAPNFVRLSEFKDKYLGRVCLWM